MSELRECPFCGCPDITILHYNHSVASCSKCGADGPPAEGAKGRDERVYMAAHLWNTRPAPDKSMEEAARDVTRRVLEAAVNHGDPEAAVEIVAAAMREAVEEALEKKIETVFRNLTGDK